MRIAGKKPAIITLAIDLLRGIILVALARYLSSDTIAVLTGLVIFMGNIYPIFFEFKGGKGIATGCGVLYGLYWALGTGFSGGGGINMAGSLEENQHFFIVGAGFSYTNAGLYWVKH